MISPITGIHSKKQTSKQNTTGDNEIRNNLTVTREEGGGILGERRGRVIKEHV